MLKAKVQFLHRYDKDQWGEKHYDYLTLKDDLKEGDKVVVETQHGFAVARFVRYTEKFKVNSVKWIVEKIDMEKFAELKTKAKQAQQIQQQITERAKVVEEERKYKAMAQEDSVMKNLLDKFNNLFK